MSNSNSENAVEMLSSVQQKYLQLMLEVDEICKSNGIPYFLSSRSALFGVVDGTMPADKFSPSILISIRDYERFIKGVESSGRENRIVESMLNNDEFPTFTMRYTDVTTTCYMVRRQKNYQVHGMHVTIHFILNIPDTLQRKMASMLESSWFDIKLPYVRKGSTQRKYELSRNLLRPYLTTGRGNGARLFKRLANLYTVDGAPYFTIRANTKRVKLNKSWVEGEPMMIDVCGHQFPVFGPPEGYLKKIYGASYVRVARRTYPPELSRIMDPNLPWDDYKQAISDFVQDESFIQEVKELNKLNRADEQNVSVIRESWNLAKLIGRKISCVDIYAENGDWYWALFESKAYGQLWPRIKPFIANIIQCDKKGIEPIADERLLTMCQTLVNIYGSVGQRRDLARAIGHMESKKAL